MKRPVVWQALLWTWSLKAVIPTYITICSNTAQYMKKHMPLSAATYEIFCNNMPHSASTFATFCSNISQSLQWHIPLSERTHTTFCSNMPFPTSIYTTIWSNKYHYLGQCIPLLAAINATSSRNMPPSASTYATLIMQQNRKFTPLSQLVIILKDHSSDLELNARIVILNGWYSEGLFFQTENKDYYSTGPQHWRGRDFKISLFWNRNKIDPTSGAHWVHPKQHDITQNISPFSSVWNCACLKHCKSRIPPAASWTGGLFM